MSDLEKIIEKFILWRKRFEEGIVNEKGEFSWGMPDWISWGIDISDGIADLYKYIRAIGILSKGLTETIADEDENENPSHIINMEEIKKMYS